MSLKPCTFFVDGNPDPLTYDQMREYLLANYDQLVVSLTSDSSVVKKKVDELRAKAEADRLKSEYESARSDYERKKSAFDKAAQQNQVNIFGNAPQEGMLFRNDLKDQRAIVDDAKTKLESAREKYEAAQKRSDDTLVGQQEISLVESLRKQANEYRAAGGGALNIVPNAIATALDALASLIEKYNDISMAIGEWRKTKEYKRLNAESVLEAEKFAFDIAGADYAPPSPPKEKKAKVSPKGKRFRGTIENFVENSDLPEDIKERLREDPRSYMETLSYDDAKTIVDAMAQAMGGIEELVEDVKKDTTKVPLELQSIVFGEGIVHAKNMGKAAKTLEEKDEWADVENELHQLMADRATQAGRYNAYFNQFYDRSDYAVIRRQKQLVDTINKTFSSVKSQEAALDEIKEVLNNQDDAAEAIEEAIQRAVGEAVSERDKVIAELEKKIAEFKKAPKPKTVKNKTGRPRRFTEDRLKELREQLWELSANPFLDPRRWEYLSYAAGYYLESGYIKFADFFKKMSKETGGKAEEYFAMLYEDAKARLIEDGYTESDFDNAETVERLAEEMMNDAQSLRDELDREKSEKEIKQKINAFGRELSERIVENAPTTTKEDRLRKLADEIDSILNTDVFSKQVDEYVGLTKEDARQAANEREINRLSKMMSEQIPTDRKDLRTREEKMRELALRLDKENNTDVFSKQVDEYFSIKDQQDQDRKKKQDADRKLKEFNAILSGSRSQSAKVERKKWDQNITDKAKELDALFGGRGFQQSAAIFIDAKNAKRQAESQIRRNDAESKAFYKSLSEAIPKDNSQQKTREQKLREKAAELDVKFGTNQYSRQLDVYLSIKDAEKAAAKEASKWTGAGLEKTIREALIEAGYGKDVNGKMQVDWRKVTGESRDAAPIVEKVKKALEGKIPPSQIDALMPVIEREANRLIMEKKTKAIQAKVKQYETRRRNRLVTRIKRNTRIQGLLETWKQGGLSNKVILDKLADDFGIVTFTEQDEAFVTDLVAQIDAAQIGAERERLEEKLQAYLEYNGFPLFLPKVFHERMKSRMLQGFVTFAKNLSGTLDAATDVAHVIAAENVKSGGDKQVFKAAFNAHRKAFVTAMDVLLRGGVDMGTAMSEITGNKEGSPSVRWMENPRSDFEGQRIVARGLRRGTAKFERVFMRALSAADTFNQVMVQEVNAYKVIKATLAQRYPDKSSKEINAMAYDIAFSEELVNARVQAQKEFNERVATQKENIKDAEARIAELQEKIDNETGVSELELLNDELAAEQAKVARAQAAIDELDLTSVVKGGRARFERRVHEIVEQEREKQSPGVTRTVQLAGNIATYKSPDPGLFSGIGILLKKAMTGMYTYISMKKAAALKDENADAVKFYEAGEFLIKFTLDYLVPFVSILGNIQEKGMEMTPYGYAKGAVYMSRAANEKNTAQALEKMSYYAFRATVGTIIGALGLALADDDEEDKMARLYGEGPENWNQKKNLAKVKPENTIVIGGSRIPLDLLGSWGMPLKMNAKMLDAERYEKDPLGFIGDLLMTTNSIWFDSPARTIANSVFGKDYKQEAQAKKMGAEVVTRATIPGVSFFRQLGQVVSPKAQNPVTFQQQLLKFAGLSGMVGMPAYDYRGKQYDTGQIFTSSADGFVKMFRDEIKIDEVDKLILRAHPGVMTLSRSTENSKIWNDDFGVYDDMSNEEFYRAGLDAAKKFDALISPLVGKMGKGVYNIDNWGQPSLGLATQEKYVRDAEEQLAAEGKPMDIRAAVDLANKMLEEDKVKMAQKEAIQEMNRVAIAASFYDYYKGKGMRVPLPVQDARAEYNRMKGDIDKGFNPFAD